MTAIYLWVNAALYGVFAVWCTLNWRGTSDRLGFTVLSESGKSEYLTIYGGLQVGLALFFAYTAWRAPLRESGLLFAVMLYGGIVVFRLISFFSFGPISGITKAVAALEVVLLCCGIWLVHTRRA